MVSLTKQAEIFFSSRFDLSPSASFSDSVGEEYDILGTDRGSECEILRNERKKGGAGTSFFFFSIFEVVGTLRMSVLSCHHHHLVFGKPI